MGDRFFNAFIAALFGAIAGIGSVWYLSAPKDPSVSSAIQQQEIDSLSVHQLTVCDPETGEALIELRDGSILARNQILADSIGGYALTGQRLQITSGDPAGEEKNICGEFATNQDGGAYMALLSPRGTHSINFGFDRQETGFILSQNNQDATMLAQVVLPIPKKGDAEVSSEETLPTQADTVSAPADFGAPPLSNATSLSLAPTGASDTNAIPNFLPPQFPL